MCRGILPSLVAHKARMFEAATDSEGVEPHALDELLSNWTTATHTRGAPFPKFLYTTPTGANPSGTSASDERKRAVLGVIRKHNLLLLEDDPYYFLSFAGLSADADPVTRARGKKLLSPRTRKRQRRREGVALRQLQQDPQCRIEVGLHHGPEGAVGCDRSRHEQSQSADVRYESGHRICAAQQVGHRRFPAPCRLGRALLPGTQSPLDPTFYISIR